MGSLVLTVGTGSTWAMRAALVLAMSGLTWQEQVFDLEDARSLAQLKRLAPAGLVPWLEHDGVRVHDSLAIAEYIHELCPDRQLYPVSLAERALARSLCAELHSGFRQIRSLLPFFLGAPTRSETPGGCGQRAGPFAGDLVASAGPLLLWRGGHCRRLLCRDGLSTGQLRHPAARSGWRLSAGAARLAPVAGDSGQGAFAVAAGGAPVTVSPGRWINREGSHWLPSLFWPLWC